MPSNELNWPVAAILSTLAVAVGIAAYENVKSSKNIIDQEILEDIELQKDIILRLRNPYTGIACSAQSQLEARTIPNSRLHTVFGVNNAFTTREMKIASAFKKAAKSLLRDAVVISKKIEEDGTSTMEDKEAEWKHIIFYIKRFVEEEINGTDEIINLTELVQFITLKISLRCLFGTSDDVLRDREAIKYVAKTINILWIRSKNMDITNADENYWSNEQRLHDHLRNLTGVDSMYGTANPMNFILPAYETMWRAVLRGFLEVYFRDAAGAHEWQQVLREFLDNPVKEVFRKEDSTTEISALDIVKEILRVYPPTRRVNRRFPDDPRGLFRSADIEKCHRNALLVPTGDAELVVQNAGYRSNRTSCSPSR